jgi:hypothetical protein
MSQDYKYFVIPFDQVPASPSYTVWYATWSTTPPILEPGMSAPLVVGAITGELPNAGTLLGDGRKDPPPPPPPTPSASIDLAEYQRSVEEWLELGRDA